jgi:hypothetical protein
MPPHTTEADRAQTAEHASSESNSVRFAEAQRETERGTVGESGDRSERPEGGDRGDATVGKPDDLAKYHEFQGDGTRDCAPYSEGTALKAYGKEFDIEKIRADGIREGTYSPEKGTDADALGNVWEREGMEVDRYGPGGAKLENGEQAFNTLQDRLSEGKAVVVAVDSGPLGGNGEGHAVWVTGMKTSPEGESRVVTNDPGVPDGAGKEYRTEDFDRAWSEYKYQMVATRDPMPETEDK